MSLNLMNCRLNVVKPKTTKFRVTYQSREICLISGRITDMLFYYRACTQIQQRNNVVLLTSFSSASLYSQFKVYTYSRLLCNSEEDYAVVHQQPLSGEDIRINLFTVKMFNTTGRHNGNVIIIKINRVKQTEAKVQIPHMSLRINAYFPHCQLIYLSQLTVAVHLCHCDISVMFGNQSSCGCPE